MSTLGNKDVQDAVVHYLDACFVHIVILQTKCRTTGLPSYYNCQVNHDTWYEHQRRSAAYQVLWSGCYTPERSSTGIFSRNQWVLGWIRYNRGLHWPSARALA
eukprot:2120993-Pyramimonas_sp.AAC.1